MVQECRAVRIGLFACSLGSLPCFVKLHTRFAIQILEGFAVSIGSGAILTQQCAPILARHDFVSDHSHGSITAESYTDAGYLSRISRPFPTAKFDLSRLFRRRRKFGVRSRKSVEISTKLSRRHCGIKSQLACHRSR